MKNILKVYVNAPLILRIAIGLVIGVLLGLFVPQAKFVTIWFYLRWCAEGHRALAGVRAGHRIPCQRR